MLSIVRWFWRDLQFFVWKIANERVSSLCGFLVGFCLLNQNQVLCVMEFIYKMYFNPETFDISIFWWFTKRYFIQGYFNPFTKITIFIVPIISILFKIQGSEIDDNHNFFAMLNMNLWSGSTNQKSVTKYSNDNQL